MFTRAAGGSIIALAAVVLLVCQDRADAAGYGSVEELVIHLVERELQVLESAESEAEVTDRLRGLGYLEWIGEIDLASPRGSHG